MSSLPFPIHTERLTLRPHQVEDAESLLSIYSRADVTRYISGDTWKREEAIPKTQLRLPKVGLDTPAQALALVIEYQREVVGDVVLWYTDAEHQVAEIGWVLHPDHSGKGFATEAVVLLLNLAFDHYGCHRVFAEIDSRNDASAKLAVRVGMQKEAHFRQDCFYKGEWSDTLVYAILESDER